MSRSQGESGGAPAGADTVAGDAGKPAYVVHVVDDDEAVRRSLALLLTSFGYVSTTYASAEALLAAADRLAPGCLIVDVRMPGMDGLALQAELAARGVPHPVIVVTGHADVPLAVRAMKAGAVDLIEKPYSGEDIMRAVRAALTRMEDVRQQQSTAEAASARIAALTPREHDVLLLLVEGRPNKAIAHELGISPRTVEIHRANVMEKLACHSLAEVVRIALAAGIVPKVPLG
ncbi:Transcriptional regulatory protein FixJ [Rhodovastum atsumiense]|uniref:Response regulator transcription factor n=1 Tax=Rhodovastum atsumiense TaxID=504468 RepID=A0A5M6J273_9PROT|nr:response regulator [Rhodovastum atsumiense]KAA5614692.1 response regulator transcription factor [Rhodovastum atsumiense]CAH2599776.1 Transcriptional regulatory protein FixJ [Rhodovastum atsumiense]